MRGGFFVLRHYRHWSLVAAEVIADRSKPCQTESPKSRVTSGASMQCRERTVSLRKIDADFLYGVVDRPANLFQNLYVERHAEAAHAVRLEGGALHTMLALDVERNDTYRRVAVVIPKAKCIEEIDQFLPRQVIRITAHVRRQSNDLRNLSYL